MKRSMKVLVFLWLSLFTISLLFTGCGGTSTDTEKTTVKKSETAPIQTATDNKEVLKPYKIIMYNPGPPQKDQPLVNEAISKYLTEKMNATLEFTQFDYGVWNDKVNLIIASGEPYDVLFTASWCNFPLNVSKGAFLPLDDLVAQYGPDILENVPKWILDGSKIKGKLYGITTMKEMAVQKGLVVQTDLVKKYQLDISSIKSVKDLEPILKTIKENEPTITPLFISPGMTPTSQYAFDDVNDGNGIVDMDSKQPVVVNRFQTQKYKELADLTRQWYKADYINKDAATNKVRGEDQMKTKKIFAYFFPLKPGLAEEHAYSSGVNLTQINLSSPYTTTGEITGAMYSISRTSKNPERAMMLINMLHGDKYLINLFTFGIEGVHYVKVSDNVIGDPPGVDAAHKSYANQGWQMGNQFLQYTYANADPKMWQNYDDWNKTSVPSPALGFIFDPSNVKSELAAINNVVDEFDPVISTGSVDSEKYMPKFLDKLKAAGMEKFIKEKQNQIDAWRAGK